MGILTPAQVLRAIKDCLYPHLEDHVGMSADPHPCRRDVPQHRIEFGPVLAIGNRIDPDEHTIGFQKLVACSDSSRRD
jgi:hypothetical protein